MDNVVWLQGMSDLCVNPKATVYYYIRDQPILQNTGKYIYLDMFDVMCATCLLEDIRLAVNDIIIWLVLWAGKMNQITCCDWLCEWARWSYLACLGWRTLSRKKYFHKSHKINPLWTKLVQPRWQHTGLILFLRVISFQSISTQKKNLANIQPSWPHTWSIAHIYVIIYFMSVWVCAVEPCSLIFTCRGAPLTPLLSQM